jgi:hypothetical protein
LLTEKEELEDLIEQYEASVINTISLRVRIREIVNDEKYNNYKLKEEVLERVFDATEEFKTFIEQEN